MFARNTNRERAFDGVRVGVAPDVFAATVIDGPVVGELPAERLVEAGAVGHQNAVPVRVFQRALHFGLAEVLDRDRLRPTAALDDGHDLALASAPALVVHEDALRVAHEGLIDLQDLSGAAERLNGAVRHRLADAVRHEPSGLDGHAQDAGELVGTEALLGRADERDGLKPHVQGHVGLFEDGPDLDGELLAAVAALLQADANALRRVRRDRADPIRATAVRADRAVRPKPRLNETISGGFVVELGAGKSAFHGRNSLMELH